MLKDCWVQKTSRANSNPILLVGMMMMLMIAKDQNKYQGIVGPDILMSGSGKLKVASIAKAAVGDKLELMLNIPKPPKPVGLGSPKGMANLGDKGAGNREAGWTGTRAFGSIDSCLKMFPFSAPTLSTNCCCCCTPAFGDSKELKELAHTWSLGVKAGRGEKDRGDTGNGENLWEERGGKPPKGKGLKPGAVVAEDSKGGAAALWSCCWWEKEGYAKVGRNGGGAIFCKRETAGLVGAGGPDSRAPEEEDDELLVPVSCCTRDLKSWGSVLYIWGAGRGCATGRRNPLAILLEALFTARAPPLRPLPPTSSTPSDISMTIGPDIFFLVPRQYFSKFPTLSKSTTPLQHIIIIFTPSLLLLLLLLAFVAQDFW